MPSPFPGMDPYLESQDLWKEFHSRLIVGVQDTLVQRVRPAYEVRAEQYVYLSQDDDESVGAIVPDVHIVDTGHGWREYAGTAAAGGSTAVARQIVLEEPIEQLYLTIRDAELRHVVTVIEILSPTNKDGSRGTQQYRQKRVNVCHSSANLVEIDLLRGGQRMPTSEPLPPGEFCAYVTRKWQAPDADVYVWSLRDRLPVIPIPLSGMDADVPLELQPVFDGVYDRAGYDYTLKYHRPLTPPLSDADRDWAEKLIAARKPLT